MDPRLERTYIMIKPDGVQRGIAGEIISRFEKKGYKLIAMKLYSPTRALLEEHYKDLKEKTEGQFSEEKKQLGEIHKQIHIY